MVGRRPPNGISTRWSPYPGELPRPTSLRWHTLAIRLIRTEQDSGLTARPLHVTVHSPATKPRRGLPLRAPRLPVGHAAPGAVGTRPVAPYRTGRAAVLRGGAGARFERPQAETAQRAGQHRRLVGRRALARHGAWRSRGQSRGGRGVGLAEATCVLANATERRARHAAHAAARVEVARHRVGRAGAEGPQVGETLRRAEVVGDRRPVGAARELQRRSLPADRVGVVAPSDTRLSVRGEVERRGTAQSPPVEFEVDRVAGVCMGLAGGRGDMRLEDLDLPSVRVSDGSMLQAHVVGKDVDLPALLGADGRREDLDLPGLVASEQRQVGVVLQSDRVIQIEV